MKIVLAILVALTFSGCVTDGLYNGIAKPVYKAGKTVVKEIPMSDELREKLKTVDKYATTYDEARGVFVIEYEVGKSDANTSKALEK